MNKFTNHGKHRLYIDDEVNSHIPIAGVSFGRLRTPMWERRGVGHPTSVEGVQGCCYSPHLAVRFRSVGGVPETCQEEAESHPRDLPAAAAEHQGAVAWGDLQGSHRSWNPGNVLEFEMKNSRPGKVLEKSWNSEVLMKVLEKSWKLKIKVFFACLLSKPAD